MITRLFRLTALAVILAGVGFSSAASVVTEDDGQFSRHWGSPTEIGFGADTVLGTAEKQNAHEFFVLTGIGAGAQSLTFDFTAPDWALASDSFSGGGQVYWSTDPFRHAWDGTSIGSFQLSRWSPKGELTLSLDESFAGPLYFGIYFTHGSDVAWRLSAPANRAAALVEPAAVPLPAGLWLMAGAMAVLGVLRRRRNVETAHRA